MAPGYVQGCDTKKNLRWGSLVIGMDQGSEFECEFRAGEMHVLEMHALEIQAYARL
jgi:hypothetical protein